MVKLKIQKKLKIIKTINFNSKALVFIIPIKPILALTKPTLALVVTTAILFATTAVSKVH